MQRLFALILMVGMSAVPMGCGSDSQPTEPIANTLDQVTLSVNESVSLGKVYLDGLPAKSSDIAVRLIVEELENRAVLVEQDEDGTFFRAPLHPLQPNIGGVVQMQVYNSQNQGPPLDLDLRALPSAPGAYEKLVDTLRMHIEQRASLSGLSFADLQSQPFESFSSSALILKIAQSYVDEMDEETDLQEIVANEGGYLSADERELLDRIIGYAPLDEVIQGEIDLLTPLKEMKSRKATTDEKGGVCILTGPDSYTAAELSGAMLLGRMADIAINPNGQAGQILGAFGAGIAAGGSIPGYDKLFKAVGMVLVVWETSSQFLAGVEPSRLSSLTFGIDRTEFAEDDTGFGQWSQVKVTAHSNGWVADKFLVSQAMKAFKSVLREDLDDEVKNILSLADLSASKIAGSATDFLSTEPGGVVEFCPRDWVVDITGLPYSTAQVADRRFSVDTSTRQFHPLEVGPDVLTVAAQPSQFAGQEAETNVDLNTPPIIVVVIPDDILVPTAGDMVNVTATIDNAEVETLLWTTAEGTWEDGIGDETNGPRTRPLKTPLNPASYPFVIRVKSTSEGGLRSSGIPERANTATVRLQQVVVSVSPFGICVPNGDPEQFVASIIGESNQAVIWSLEDEVTGEPSSEGSISSSGLYTAPPSGAGSVVVVATSVAQPSARGVALIQYGTCSCFWELIVAGEGTWTGDFATHDLGVQLPWFSLSLVHSDSELEGTGGVQSNPGPGSGETGSWPVTVFSFLAGARAFVAGGDDTQAMMVVTENTNTKLEGFVSGTCAALLNGEETLRTFTLEFRSGSGEFACQSE